MIAKFLVFHKSARKYFGMEFFGCPQPYRSVGNVRFLVSYVFCNFVLWGDRGGVKLQAMNSYYSVCYNGSRNTILKNVVFPLTRTYV